jgi:hypothetical protein
MLRGAKLRKGKFVDIKMDNLKRRLKKRSSCWSAGGYRLNALGHKD